MKKILIIGMMMLSGTLAAQEDQTGTKQVTNEQMRQRPPRGERPGDRPGGPGGPGGMGRPGRPGGRHADITYSGATELTAAATEIGKT